MEWIGMEGIVMKVKGIAIITIPLFIRERFGKGASEPTHNTQPSSLEEVFSCSPSGLSKSQEKLCVAVRDPHFVGRAHWKLIEECAGL